MSEEKKYFLFNTATRVSSEALASAEFAALLKDEDLASWLFWMDGMSDWQPVSENETAKALLLFKKKPVPPPIPKIPPPVPAAAIPTTPEPEIIIFEETSLVSILQPLAPAIPDAAPLVENPIDKRQTVRVDLRLRAVITNKVKAFITFTQNVSLGGMLVLHSIPEEILVSECEVFLFNPLDNTGVSFKCSPIPASSDKNRFSFVINEEKHHDTLKKWIEAQARSHKTA